MLEELTAQPPEAIVAHSESSHSLLSAKAMVPILSPWRRSLFIVPPGARHSRHFLSFLYMHGATVSHCVWSME